MYKARGASHNSDHLLEGQKNTCQTSLDIIIDTLDQAGFDAQTTKDVGAARSQVFLGLEVNAKDKIVRLHDDRKFELMNDLCEWKNSNMQQNMISSVL